MSIIDAKTYVLTSARESSIVYTCVHIGTQRHTMAQNETKKIGVRQFRENFANYLGKVDQPIAITRHQDIVGYYIPARPRRTEDEKVALREAVAKLHEILDEKGISAEEVFQQLKSVREKGAAAAREAGATQSVRAQREA